MRNKKGVNMLNTYVGPHKVVGVGEKEREAYTKIFMP